MPAFKDLTGQKYGRLTVIQRAPNKGNQVQWECLCDCGNICIIARAQLQSGKTKSCGCLRKENCINFNQTTKRKDLTNQKFGELVALYPTDERDAGQIVWMCQCSCGQSHKVRGSLLTSGLISSCGHQKSKSENCIKKLLNQYKVPYEIEKIFSTCKYPQTKHAVRFDFYINNSYLIEFDGIQHFYNTGWNNFDEVQKHDNFKNEWCKANNIPLIRIPYTHLQNLTIEDLILETSKFII